MVISKRRIAGVLIGALMLGAACGGGSSKSASSSSSSTSSSSQGGNSAVGQRPSAEWTADVCRAINTFAKSVTDTISSLESGSSPGTNAEKKAVALKGLDAFVKIGQQLEDDISSAGTPDVANGATLADNVAKGYATFTQAADKARNDFEAVSPDDPNFASKASPLLEDALNGFVAQNKQFLDSLNGTELERAFNANPDCQSIASIGGG